MNVSVSFGCSWSMRTIVGLSIATMVGRFTDRLGRRHVRFLTGEAPFAEEFAGAKHSDDAFFALMRDDGDLHPAVLDVIDGVGGVSLAEYRFLRAVSDLADAGADRGEKRSGIEGRSPNRFRDPPEFRAGF